MRKKRQYKKLCEKKKKDANDRWIEEVEKIREERKVCEVINSESKRRKGVSSEIEEGEWKEYFMGLLGGVEGKVMMEGEGTRRAGGEEGLRREEVSKVIREIKKGKAMDVNGISGEAWKYGGVDMER